ncbi:MAG: type III pantothenate kinase [Candidatus Auribacter fodinae]|jgi:type III pantothenate kinase|uniref:Type III pantothenate kinase n=1 Tax=Candidatus Auribacter fodinae TaxID=2093366 RepID=A0A3A4RC73_9BACT|nr:MAG: type III pantothenate kinase [Candidatus Auribacter fodinae]
MIFVVDVGNSAAHFGVYSDGLIIDKLVVYHGGKSFSPSSIENISQWLKKFQTISSAAVGTVNRVVDDGLRSCFKNIPLTYISSGADIGMRLDYTPAGTLGADRFANLVAFRQRYRSPGAIIDIGSAVTIDILDPRGNFYGGMIFPGPALSLKALHTSTELLPLIELDDSSADWGHTTEKSIRCGVFKLYRHAIEGIIAEARTEFVDARFTTVACGGWSLLWQQYWHDTVHFDTDLTLKGIGDIYYLLKSGKKL